MERKASLVHQFRFELCGLRILRGKWAFDDQEKKRI